MKKIIYTTLIFGVLIGAGACRKYVEIPPEQTRSLRYTSDYQQLLNNTSTFDNAYHLPVFAGDDIGSTDDRWMNALYPLDQNTYTWAERLFPSDENDSEWASQTDLHLQYGLKQCNGQRKRKPGRKAKGFCHRPFTSCFQLFHPGKYVCKTV